MHLLGVYQGCHCISHIVENGRCWTFLRLTWGKSQRQVLLGCSSIAAMFCKVVQKHYLGEVGK